MRYRRGYLLGVLTLLTWGLLAGPAVSQEIRRGPFSTPAGPAADPLVPAPSGGLPTGRVPQSSTKGNWTPLIVPLNKAQVIDLPSGATNVVVANEAVADVHLDPANPQQMFILARSIGTTAIFVMDESGNIVHEAAVEVVLDQTPMELALADLMPDEDLKVAVYQGSVFLRGQVSSPAASARAVEIVERLLPEGSSLVNMLKIRGRQQVILQVRVAEMNRQVIKTLRTSMRVDGSTIGALGNRGIFFTTAGSTLRKATAEIASGTLNLGLPYLDPLSFSTLEQQGLVKTLAEPTLVALSGESAAFTAGGQYPFPTNIDDNGNVVFEFREFGVQLSFMPEVLTRGRINLQIRAEVSEIDSSTTVTVGTLTIPAISTNRTETVIEMASGGSLMISGLLNENYDSFIEGFPYLKDVPILGTLFRSNQFFHDKTELVVLVNTYLAKEIDGKEGPALPTDGLIPPSDADFYLLGRLNREGTKEKETPFWRMPFGLKGPFGYIMEDTP